MGDPKKQRKKYQNPRFAWSKAALDAELRLLGEYGLRNKTELRRHRFMLSKYRTLSRKLLAETPDDRGIMEKQILSRLSTLKLIPENSNLDDVLDLTLENILERRLQTLVYRRGLSKSPQQARQLITHGHILVKGQRITAPSYLVKSEEESQISCRISILPSE
ncbi:MAG: 30S ribosomal protein S4 [Candidatus Bathyarchaeota archaeon]|nr:MAG: 30S ribosomal protein S4 [Candidatus Bathyarchaeota archaeon]